MKKILLGICLFFLCSAPAFAVQKVSGWCAQGAVSITVGGVGNAVPPALAIYSGCTVYVTVTGQPTNPATLYSDDSGHSLSNPFTAAASGLWQFYVADGRWDVTVSGGTPAPGISSPNTFSDINVPLGFTNTQGSTTIDSQSLEGLWFCDYFASQLCSNAIATAGSTPAVIVNPTNNTGTGEVIAGAGNAAVGGSSYTTEYTGCTYQSGIQVWDFRNGLTVSSCDPTGNTLNTGSATIQFANQWSSNYSQSRASPVNQYLADTAISVKALGGGQYLSTSAYRNQTNFSTLILGQRNATRGYVLPLQINVASQSLGDSYGLNISNATFGTGSESGDQGAGAINATTYEPPFVYQGSLVSPTTGATSLNATVTQDGLYQGEGHYLVDNTLAYTTGTITSVAGTDNQGVGYPTLSDYVGSGTGWTANSVLCLTSTAITAPGTYTVSVGSFAIGANLSGIVDGTTVILIADAAGAEWETVKSSAHTSNSFTATFTKAYATGAIVSIGAGGSHGPYFIALDSDTFQTLPRWSGYTRYVRQYWPVLYVVSATKLVPWISGQGAWSSNGYVGHGVSSTYANTYRLEPGAEITSVQVSGSVSPTTNTFGVAPNAVVWANADTIEVAHYPNQVSNPFVSQSTLDFVTSGGGRNLGYLIGGYSGYGGPQADGLIISNIDLSPDQVHPEYKAYNNVSGNSGATMLPPIAAVHVSGDYLIGLRMEVAPIDSSAAAAVSVGCPPKGNGSTSLDCTRNIDTPLIYTAAGVLSINQSNGVWKLGGVGGLVSASFSSVTNCLLGGATGTASPAACGSAPAGRIAIPASQTTYQVNTSAVTANSTIMIQQTTDNSGLPSSPTCSPTVDAPMESARTGGEFTFTLTSVAAVMCYNYWIVN